MEHQEYKTLSRADRSYPTTWSPSGAAVIQEKMGRPVGEALIAVDRTSHIIYANNGASIVFGWEPKELNGLPLEALIPQRHHGAHRDHVRLFVDSNSAGRTIERPGIWARTKQGFNFECTLVIGKVGPADDPVLVTSVRLRGEP